MLPKVNKLPAQEFLKKRDSQDLKTIRSRWFIARTQPNTIGKNRFNILIAKKFDKRAVVRNKIKRILFNRLVEKNMIKKGTERRAKDTLISIAPHAQGVSQEDLLSDFDALIHRTLK